MHKKRNAAGGGGGGSNNSDKKLKKQIKALTKKVSNQKRQLAAIQATDAGDDSDTSGENDKSSNRNHAGLTRQKKPRKK